MKKATSYYFTLVIILLFTACQKDTSAPDNTTGIMEMVQQSMLAAEDPKDGQINIQSFKQAGSLIPQDQQPFDGYVGGVFYINKDDTRSTTVSKFNVQGFDIPYNNYPAYPGYGLQSNGSSQTVKDWMKNLFGKKVKVSLKGSSTYRTDVEDSSFYVPKEITFTSDFLQTRTYNVNNPYTITWPVDPLNTNGLVYIGIVYEAVESNKQDQSLPDSSFVQALLKVSDNGSYTITPDKVANLPTNGIISITVARGTYKVMADQVTGTQTLIYAVTMANTSSTIKIVR